MEGVRADGGARIEEWKEGGKKTGEGRERGEGGR